MLKKRRLGVMADLSTKLNLIALVAAVAGLLLPVTQMTPERFVFAAESLVASSGVSLSAAVPANPYSSVAQQLSDKERALAERENALSTAEAPKGLSMGEIMGFVSFVLSVILCMLIGLNFYLDSRRSRKPGVLGSKFSVDLR